MANFGNRTRVNTEISSWGFKPGDSARYPIVMDYLVLGGGGGSAANTYAGGAGGMRSSVIGTGGSGANPESTLNDHILFNTNYTVTVGAGGSVTPYPLNNGGNSIFGPITAKGGFGGGHSLDFTTTGGYSGYAGGGDPNQGYPGKPGNGMGNWNGGNAGGGGGAGGAGGDGAVEISPQNPPNTGGVGGIGRANAITGVSVTYGGGGGGAAAGNYPYFNGVGGAGGVGGGGNAGNGAGYPNGGPSPGTATNGTAGLGGGGGGGTQYFTPNTTTGGSGRVVLRWLTAAGTITIGAGLTYTTDTYSSYSIANFTAGNGVVYFTAP